ncbi:MAG: SDR family oxidoreductase [Pseudomonadota bacterium]
MSKSVLLTGANGFVGRQVAKTLLEREFQLTCALRQPGMAITGAREAIVGNIDGATDWSACLAGVDVVIHVAARVHVMDETSGDPLSEFRKVNVEGSLNLARQAVAAGVKRLVYVSSIKVNGEATTGTAYTAFDVPAPLDPYGQSKLEAEVALLALSRESSLEVVIVRPPLVYGPGVRANFQRLMQLVKSGVPLPLGAIANRRSMVALENLADLLVLCASHRAAPGNVFLVSDGQDVSISELLRLLASGMGKRARLISVPAALIAASARLLGKSAVADRLLGSLQVDIAHTRETLGWAPVISVREAVQSTARSFLAV